MVGEAQGAASALGLHGEVELCVMGHKGFDDEGVDVSNAAIHVDEFVHASVDEGFGSGAIEVEAHEVVLSPFAE